MFEAIIEIIKKIVVFSLISYCIGELTPGEEYKKYINLFSGMVLVLIVLGPVYDFLYKSNSITQELDRFLIKDEITDMNTYFNEYDEMRTKTVIQDYNDMVVENITAMVLEEQLYVNSIDIEFNLDAESEDFLQILSVNLAVSKKYQNTEIKVKEILLDEKNPSEDVQVINIKNKISQFYNVETDNINISK